MLTVSPSCFIRSVNASINGVAIFNAAPTASTTAANTTIGIIAPSSALPKIANTATSPAMTPPNTIIFLLAASPALAIGPIARAIKPIAAPKASIPPMLLCSFEPNIPTTATSPETTAPKAPIAAAPSSPVDASGAIARAIADTDAAKAITPFILLCSFFPVSDSTTATADIAAANDISGATAVVPSDARGFSASARPASDPMISAIPAFFASEPRPSFNFTLALLAFLLLFPKRSNVSVAPVSGASHEDIFLYPLNAAMPAKMTGTRLDSPSAFLFAHFAIAFSGFATPAAVFFKTSNAGVSPSIMPFKLICFITDAIASKAFMILPFAIIAASAMVGRPFCSSISSIAAIHVVTPFVTPVFRLVNAVAMPPHATCA